MDRCECCGGASRRLRKFQKNFGVEETTTMVCPNCFAEALDISKDILNNAGTIAFEITRGVKKQSIDTTDGRKITLEIK